MRIGLAVVVSAAVLGVVGCKSAYVEADVVNATGATVTLVEVDYPSASFGVESLGAGAVYPYRFQVLGSGSTKLLWTDAARQQHTAQGPELHEGQQGALTITIQNGGADWKTALRP